MREAMNLPGNGTESAVARCALAVNGMRQESALNPFAVASLGDFCAVSSGARNVPERSPGGPRRSWPQNSPKMGRERPQDSPNMLSDTYLGPKRADTRKSTCSLNYLNSLSSLNSLASLRYLCALSPLALLII